MTAGRYFLLLNWAVAFCNGYQKPITEPFTFQSLSDFVKDSKDSSEELIKNPASYSNKSATKVEIILEPLKMSKIDPDENVSLENDD